MLNKPIVVFAGILRDRCHGQRNVALEDYRGSGDLGTRGKCYHDMKMCRSCFEETGDCSS
jgi:hypothetical protein